MIGVMNCTVAMKPIVDAMQLTERNGVKQLHLLTLTMISNTADAWREQQAMGRRPWHGLHVGGNDGWRRGALTEGPSLRERKQYAGRWASGHTAF